MKSIKEIIADEKRNLDEEKAIGSLSDYGRGKEDGLFLATIAAEQIIDVPVVANKIMVYVCGCLQDGPPFERAAIEKILRGEK